MSLLTALQSLLDNLDPSHDMPTHQWLAERVAGHARSAQDDISVEDWFQMHLTGMINRDMVPIDPYVMFYDTSLVICYSQLFIHLFLFCCFNDVLVRA